MQTIELLSPARNLSTAREAILHGADAVYIGAPRFGARVSAGNSLEDIKQLVDFAHVFSVRVYVTLNTILFDDELEDARLLAIKLYEMGVDALIVQDMAFLEMDLPPIPLHASTQMDNRNAQKVHLLQQVGFEQVVLARELSLDEIRDIHNAVPDMPLEVFVHGATCVSYNGQCYASQYCFGRSANRGECAQFCRLPFDLVDAAGHPVRDGQNNRLVLQRHLLSLHDMNRSEHVEELMEAGVSSFKIEGRLKDEAYVKNVTAYYRMCIDRAILRHPDKYKRSSLGISSFSFTPQLERTFNRGFSSYFLHGRTRDMVQACSPKSIGQHVGHVKEIRRNCFTVSTTTPFSNGDGLCFLDAEGKLQGFRVNRVEGNCLFPKEMPQGLKPRTPLYRNLDHSFLQTLSHPTAKRRISVIWNLSERINSSQHDLIDVVVTLTASGDTSVQRTFSVKSEVARSPQKDNLVRQFSRLGETPFCTDDVRVEFSQDWFIPSSLLGEWRRVLVEELLEKLKDTHASKVCAHVEKEFPKEKRKGTERTNGDPIHCFEGQHLTYLSNVSNKLSRQWYLHHGAYDVESAMESGGKGNVLMTLRYCPRYELGLCGKNVGQLFLRASDNRVFPLKFDCRKCVVQVLSPQSSFEK